MTDDWQDPLDLDAIEARTDAAEGGPWEVVDRAWIAKVTDGRGYTIVGKEQGQNYHWLSDDPTLQFIAAAREDVPALVQRVRELTELMAAGFVYNQTFRCWVYAAPLLAELRQLKHGRDEHVRHLRHNVSVLQHRVNQLEQQLADGRARCEGQHRQLVEHKKERVKLRAEAREAGISRKDYEHARRSGATHAEVLEINAAYPPNVLFNHLPNYALCRKDGVSHSDAKEAAAAGIYLHDYRHARRAGATHAEVLEAAAFGCDLEWYARVREYEGGGVTHEQVLDYAGGQIPSI